jgi:hypothetical protein
MIPKRQIMSIMDMGKWKKSKVKAKKTNIKLDR